MTEKIGIIDIIEDDSYQGKDFKKVVLKGGEILKVKYGREGFLKAKWGELQVGRAYSWTMGDYQGHPFVQDFTAVSNELAPPTEPQVSEREQQVVDEAHKATPPNPQAVGKGGYKADPAKTESIENQVSLKTAVELAVAAIIPPEKILSYAEVFKRYIRGDIEVKDEAVFAALIDKHFKTKKEG